MGGMVSDSATLDVIAQINKRFEAGEPLEEIVALQREFRIFSPAHGLYDSWALLNIKAANPAERPRWRRWTEYIKGIPSDLPGVNGHDRLVKAYQENLEGPNPMPMFYKHHLAKDDPRVLVYTGRPILILEDEHVITSIPVIPVTSSSRISTRKPASVQAPAKELELV